MKYFTIEELCHSDVARANGIPNNPPERIAKNLTELIEKVLDPIRGDWGAPIIVSSGYRCSELNQKVGGVPSSAHLIGFAADVIPQKGHFSRFKKVIHKWAETNNFDQIIVEKNSKGAEWIHIGLYNQGGSQRKQIFQLNPK